MTRGVPAICLLELTAFGLLVHAADAANLVGNGDFAAAGAKPGENYLATGGTFEVFTETPSWNRCGKFTLGEPNVAKDGVVTSMGYVFCGCDPASRQVGFRAEPETSYAFSFEIRGEAPAVSVAFYEWDGPDSLEDGRKGETSVKSVVPKKDVWTVVKGTFRTSPQTKRAALRFGLYASTKYKMKPLPAGTYYLVDNIKVEPVRNRFAKLRAGRFSLAPVDPCGDFAVPFLPDEVFDPPTNLSLRACINEVRALPLALANLTDEAAEYRVILETLPERGRDDGVFGLAGFPADRIVARMGVRMKETDTPPVTLRFDPLVRMNEINTVMVPAREAGLIWFDFDTAGVKPGVYRGRIRVLPLGEPGEWKCLGSYNDRVYRGVGRAVPISLEVLPVELPQRPVRPTMLCGKADTESCYRLMADLGATDFAISPWYFQFHRQTNGDLDLARPKEGVQAARRDIRNHTAWSAKYGHGRPRFLVMYSSFETMKKLYAPKDLDEALRLWVQFLKGVRQVMVEEGVRDGEYMVEAWDEPPNAEAETVFAALSLAKREVPQVRMQLTLGSAPEHGFDAKNFARLVPYVDNWENWRFGYFSDDQETAMRAVRARGATLSHYSCGTSMREPCYFTFRLMPWFGERWKLDADGLFQFANGAGGNNRCSFKSTTYGEISYRSFDTFVPSVRYMAIREGQTDIRYLEALRRLRGDDPSVRRFLEDAPRRVFDDGPHDITIAPRLRQQALELILKGK